VRWRHFLRKLTKFYSYESVSIRALEFPRREFPALKSVEFQLEFPAQKWPFRGNSLEFPYRGGHRNYRGGLSGGVATKIVRIFFASCSAVLSPGLMALPIPDVDMQLAISKPVLNERGLQREPSAYSFR